MKRKKLIGNLVALLVGLIIAVGGAELYLRLTPNSTNNYGTDLRYAPHPMLGYTLAPGQDATVNLPCTRIQHIRTNALGFRDTEWKPGSKPSIAVLGDSFQEAVHLRDGDHTCDLLEKLLGVEVLNASVSGYGTVAQLMAYREVLRPLHPQVVVLFFFTQNDFLNNHCSLDIRTGNHRAHPCPCAMLVDGTPQFLSQYPDSIRPILPPAPTGFHLWDYVRHKVSPPARLPSNIWAQYLPPWTGQYAEARTLTQAALRQLRQEVEADGAKLVIVSVPPYLDMLGADFAQEVKDVTGWAEVPPNWDSRYPLRVLDTLASQEQIPLLKMEDHFRAYLQAHKVDKPLLSFPCDGHHNPVGHWLMAHHTASFLLDQRTLDLDSATLFAKQERILAHLRLSPQQVLGDTAYQQIYGSGPFTGATQLSQQISR